MPLQTAVTLCVLAGALAPFSCAARALAVPPNDAFTDAMAIAGQAGRTTGSTIDATRERDEPDHAGKMGAKSAWWTWRPARDGLATIYTFGSSFDTLLGVYTGGSPASLDEVASNDDINDESFLSLVTFQAREADEYRIAVDGFEGASGMVVLAWHLDSRGSAPPPNDAFDLADVLDRDAGSLFATNRNATVENGEPPHAAGGGGMSVWWTWTPSSSGVATIHTSGSSFDTKLAVYTGDAPPSLARLASDDNAGEGYASQVILEVAAGGEYRIAVDGADAAGSSVIHLTWSLSPLCDGPDTPGLPSPPDGYMGVSTAALLEWNRPPRVRPLVVYGTDDRLDVYETDDPAIASAWASTVAVVRSAQLEDRGDGTHALPGRTLGMAYNLCEGERFADQPNPALCSGFLVAPDLVVTSASCISGESDCSLVVLVFGFRMLGPAEPTLIVPASQVYRCAGVEGARLGDDPASWAVVRLDRPVPDHTPLRIRRKGKVADQQALFAIGHPGGLPAKIALNGRVRENRPIGYFVTNLDAWIQSAGSAVFNADTGEVEGVLVGGTEDLEDLGECYRTKSCEDSGCSGEPATRITELSHLIPTRPDSFAYKVYFGPCGSLVLAGETPEPSWDPGPLEPGATYCWQVVAADECGGAPGPVWSFTTEGARARFRRGDSLDDGLLDISDAVQVLNWLFLGKEEPTCLSSADVDDNGMIDITDPVALLSHLFLGGPEPEDPFSECGTDPSPDGLGCATRGPCAAGA